VTHGFLSSLLRKLQKKEFRDAYAADHLAVGIPFQIRALRKQRGWNQAELARRWKKQQSWVSEIEREGKASYTIATLSELAAVFDVALVVKFVPYSRFLKEYEDVSESALEAASFEDELPRLKAEVEGNGLAIGDGAGTEAERQAMVGLSFSQVKALRDALNRVLKENDPLSASPHINDLEPASGSKQ